jgi:hypothetical protein
MKLPPDSLQAKKNRNTTASSVSSVLHDDGTTSASVWTNIAVTSDESIDTTPISNNTSSSSRTGTIQVSSDNYNTSVRMSSVPYNSNFNWTFSVTSSSNLSYSTTYKVRIIYAAKDTSGNILGSQYQASFTTKSWTKQLGITGSDNAHEVTTDSSGNVYVTGSTSGGLDGNTSRGC